MPSCSPMSFFRILQQQKETQVLLAAIRLDVFSYLDHPVSAEEVASLLTYDAENVEHLLRALVSMNILEKKGCLYCNTPEAKLYLSKQSQLYLGEYFIFWEKKTSLSHIEELVRFGTKWENTTSHSFYDFHELARLSAVEIKTGRVQSFLHSAVPFFSKDQQIHLLDLGGGSGRMTIEFIKEYSAATGIVFEHPAVVDVPIMQIKQEGLEEQISVIQGDFVTDDFGNGYDLVIASGILDFAGTQVHELLARIYHSCRPGAYLYLVSHDVNDELTSPKESILGWLSSHLAGLHILRPKSQIKSALLSAGFEPVQEMEQQGAIAKLQGEWYKKKMT